MRLFYENHKFKIMIGLFVIVFGAFIWYNVTTSVSSDYTVYDDVSTLLCMTSINQVVDDYEEYSELVECLEVPKEIDESFFDTGFVVIHSHGEDRRFKSLRVNENITNEGTTITIRYKDANFLTDEFNRRLFIIELQEEDVDKNSIEINHSYDND